MNKRLFIILLLGFSSGLPLSLVGSTLQAWFAESGMSVMATGSLSLISFPYVYRFIWAPLLDRYSFSSIGKRRSWMLFMQLLLFAGFIILSFLNPKTTPLLMALIALAIACFSATQDVAIEAHRTEFLERKEYGLGASIAVFGYRLALLISGGLALVIAGYYGWRMTYLSMAALMLVGIYASLISPEPSKESKPKEFFENYLLPMRDLYNRPRIFSLLAFIFLFKSGEAFTSTISGIVMPFLINGLGFDVATIGWVNKIIGVSAVIVGGLIAGLIMLRYSLFKSLMLFGLLQAITNIFFVLLALSDKSFNLLIVSVISDNLATGMGTTALVAFLMRIVNQSYTATQLSILVAFSALPRILSGPFAASVQLVIGWVGVYQLSVIIALLYIPFLIVIRKQVDSDRENSKTSTARLGQPVG